MTGTTPTSSTLKPNNPALFGLALALTVAGVWISPYPPLVDFPQHAAQIVALQEYWAGNPVFTETFELNWFAPYTATYLVYYVLALVLPITVAGKLLITLSVIAVPLLMRRLLQEVGTDPFWSWLTIPGCLSVAFYWGFMPYMLATAVGMYLWLLTIRFGRNPTVPKGIGIALCTVLLFFCHVIALGFTALVALVYLAAVNYAKPRQILLSWLPYAAGLPFVIYWYVSTIAGESYVQGAAISFGSVTERVETLIAQTAGQGGMTHPLILVLGLALIAIPFIAGARFSPKLYRWLPFAVAVIMVALMPAKAFGAIFLYHRLSIFLVPLLLLALDFPAEQRPKSYSAVMLVVVICGLLNLNRFNEFNRETLGFSRIVTLMEERKNVLNLAYAPWSPTIQFPTHFHIGLWYQVEKRGIVDFNFAFFYASMVRFREGQHEWIPRDILVWNAGYFQFDLHNGDFYDYFVIYSFNDPTAYIFKQAQDRVELVEHSNGWWLYKRAAKPQ